MTFASLALSAYMRSPVATVAPEDEIELALNRLTALNVSALAVRDAHDDLVGVITRTDLLRVGRRQAGRLPRASVLTLPRRPVAELMEPDVITLAPDASIAKAAALMVHHRVHRVFVCEGRKLRGVVSTKDVTRAVSDERVTTPIRAYMSANVITVGYDEPVSLAVERLEKAHISGLVVVEDDWPIGVFTQVEALESKDAMRDTPVEHVLSPAMLCLDVDTPLHRAAAHASSMDVRRIIAVHDRRLEGVMSGLDFARAASA